MSAPAAAVRRFAFPDWKFLMRQRPLVRRYLRLCPRPGLHSLAEQVLCPGLANRTRKVGSDPWQVGERTANSLLLFRERYCRAWAERAWPADATTDWSASLPLPASL